MINFIYGIQVEKMLIAPLLKKRTAFPSTCLVLTSFLWPMQGLAQSFDQALAEAYQTNPRLMAARAQLRSIDEGVAQARAVWLPSLTVQGDAGVSSTFESHDRRLTAKRTNVPYSIQVSLSQSIFAGGANIAGFNQAKNLVKRQQATLDQVEQTIMQEAVTAYVNVVRDRAIVELSSNNVEVLQRQLEATQDRFLVGENTRTDVAQAESRLARAQARLTDTEGNLAITRASYIRVIGTEPGLLNVPSLPDNLPTSLDEVVKLAIRSNPTLMIANSAEAAASNAVDVRIGGLLPNFSLGGTVQRNVNSVRDGHWTTSGTFGARMTVPLFAGGRNYSRIRQAKQTHAQARAGIDDARTQVIEAAVQAWEQLLKARAQIISYESGVVAAQTALEGVIQENQVGSRTVLEVLNAEQELLDAQVDLVTARRDEIVAGYSIMRAIGSISAKKLGLPVELYDPNTYSE